MNVFRMLVAGGGRDPISVTFTQNTPWTAPVSTLTRVSGFGARGQNATQGYQETINRTEYACYVSHIGSSFEFASPGQVSWGETQGAHVLAAQAINAGGNGSFKRENFYQYTNGRGYDSSQVAFSNAVPGSASTYFSGGWKTSGSVVPGDFAYSYVTWQEYGAFVPGSPATTGASATAFGLTFPGSTGNVAQTTTTFNNVAVTQGQQYQIVVPAGGSITITY